MPKNKFVLVTCKIPPEMASAIDRLVEDKIFQSRSEAIRYAIGSLISTHFNKKGKESWIEE